MLNSEQESKLKEFIDIFKKYSKTESFKADTIDREKRRDYFSKLTREKIQGMDKFLFGEIVSKLWASGFWGNKDYLINNILSQNNFEALKEDLSKIFFEIEDSQDKYNEFREKIKGLGPSSMTELFCLISPEKYGIWNDKARKALKILKFDEDLPVEKYSINGEQYKKFNSILKEIALSLEKNGFKEVNLLFVDYFLYEVWKNGDIKEKVEIEKEESLIFDHEEMKEYVREIGEALGFETDTEKKVAYGAIVDVIWKAKIGNLGVVIYAFEVQSKGSTDSLILNLQKAKSNRSVQKLIVVSDSLQNNKIKREIEGLPEEIRKAFSFWDVNDVKITHQKLSEVKESIDKLDLVKDEFEIERG